MRYITIDQARPGMILSRQIFDQMDHTLLDQGKILNQELIERLKARGFSGVYIEDELSWDIQIEEAITEELRSFAAQSLQELDVDAVLESSRRIVEHIIRTGRVSLDLLDLRGFDDYTYRHSVNVAVLSLAIAVGLGYRQEEMVDLAVAAILHDIGKMSVEKSILNKPGKLSPAETEAVRQHPRISHDLLVDKWKIPARVKAAVLLHHENEDGSGYPMGLSGDDIHPFAKVIHVADVYDALCSKRPYKEPCSFSEALEYLMGGSGTLFDYHVVRSFMGCVPVYPKGITVELSDGREAIVIENRAGNQLRPKLRLMDGAVLDLMNLKENRNLTILRQASCNAMVNRSIVENERGRQEEASYFYKNKLKTVSSYGTIA